MSKLSKKHIIVFLLPVFVGLALFSYFKIFPEKSAQAGAGENVSGWAWSSNIGWISANSLNCDTNSDGKSEGVPPDCPAAGTVIPNYGLNIADNGATGVFSGYAWGDNIGWLSFNEADLINCPSAPCQAWVDKKTGQVYGWAKFLQANEWLRLQGANYGVSIDKTLLTFSGWAWGGETAGWINFNCYESTGDYCPTNNYEVSTTFDLNIKPTVELPLPPPTNPNPNPNPVNMCANPAYSFSWIFNDLDDDGSQTKYQLQVDKTSSGDWVAGPGEFDETANKSAVKGELQTKEITLAKNPIIGQLDYKTTYQWRLRVYDNWGGVSPWAQGINFITPTHIYPTPNFTWSPLVVIKDQEVNFCSVKLGACDTDISTCYGAGSPSCKSQTFLWEFPAGKQFVGGTDETRQNPKVKFTIVGKNQVIKLTITDDVGACAALKNINVMLPLPGYHEVPIE